MKPAVFKHDYAKWMLDDPRVNFAISARGREPGLDHLGIQAENQTGDAVGRGRRPMALADVVSAILPFYAVAAMALEFAILTAARSGEVLGARWAEIDFQNAIWTVPANRMKGSRPHRVSLSRRAIAILNKMEAARAGEFVFPGQRAGKPLSVMALEMMLRRMKVKAVTVHGFRSSFRDWCGEVSTFPREVAEAALAHISGDATERAYRRGDALEKRRKLMEAWSSYCEPKLGNVVSLAPRPR